MFDVAIHEPIQQLRMQQVPANVIHYLSGINLEE